MSPKITVKWKRANIQNVGINKICASCSNRIINDSEFYEVIARYGNQHDELPIIVCSDCARPNSNIIKLEKQRLAGSYPCSAEEIAKDIYLYEIAEQLSERLTEKIRIRSKS